MVRYMLGFVILQGVFMGDLSAESGKEKLGEFVVDGSVNRLTKGAGRQAEEGAAEVLTGPVIEAPGEIVKSEEEVEEEDCVLEVEEAILRDLGPKQVKALELLLKGRPVKEIAKKVRVHRVTLHKWMKRNAAFAAAYNQWHEHMQGSVQSRLMMMGEKAADALEKALERGDGRLAMRYFEKMGFAKEREVGPTNVEEVREQRELTKRKKKMEQRKLRRELGADETGIPPWE
jgi:hypothetical protein